MTSPATCNMPQTRTANVELQPRKHGGIGHAGWFALLVPALLLLVFVAIFARSYPVWETWFFIPTWKDFATGGPWIKDLFVTRWGHISAFPSLVYLLLDHTFNYDQRVDIWFSVLAAITTLYLLLRVYLPRSAPLTGILLGVVFLSIRADEIWLDGWNIMMTVPLLIGIAAGACALKSDSWKAFLGCAALALLGVNSGGYCLPVLPAVLVLLAAKLPLRSDVRRSRIKAQITAWLFWALALVGYWHFMRRGNAWQVMETVFEPSFYRLVVRQFAFVFGANRTGYAALALVVLLFAAGLAVSRRRPAVNALPALGFLATYAIVLVLLIDVARTVHGGDPVHSRYIPFLALLLIAMLAYAETVFGHRTATQIAPSRLAITLALSALIIVVLFGDYRQWQIVRGFAPQLAALDKAYQHAPNTLTPGMFLGRAALDPALVAQGLNTMRALRIGPFTRDSSLPVFVPPSTTLLDGTHVLFGTDRVSALSTTVVVDGWAFDTASKQSAKDVFAIADNGCVETALRGLPRPDVARHFASYSALKSGWLVTFPGTCLRTAHGGLTLYFVADNQHWTSVRKHY